MQVPEVCGVLVTFYPDADVLANLEALRVQVGGLVVVDNGSPSVHLQPLCAARNRLGFTLIENAENLGIATALNQGVRWALAAGFRWVLLSDQDSCVTPGFALTMLNDALKARDPGHLAILVPRYVDSRLGHVHASPVLADGSLEAATTSGSLMPASIFAAAGLFDDGLFIDGVDFEYSLRVRALGYRIAECAAATLLHAPGTPSVRAIAGVSSRIQVANYSPVRRYYQERNKILVARTYGTRFGMFFLKQFIISGKDLIKVLLYEDGKGRKLRAFVRGWWDGLRGVRGKMQ